MNKIEKKILNSLSTRKLMDVEKLHKVVRGSNKAGSENSSWQTGGDAMHLVEKGLVIATEGKYRRATVAEVEAFNSRKAINVALIERMVSSKPQYKHTFLSKLVMSEIEFDNAVIGLILNGKVEQIRSTGKLGYKYVAVSPKRQESVREDKQASIEAGRYEATSRRRATAERQFRQSVAKAKEADMLNKGFERFNKIIDLNPEIHFNEATNTWRYGSIDFTVSISKDLRILFDGLSVALNNLYTFQAVCELYLSYRAIVKGLKADGASIINTRDLGIYREVPCYTLTKSGNKSILENHQNRYMVA